MTITWECSTLRCIMSRHQMKPFTRKEFIAGSLAQIITDTDSIGKTPDMTLSRTLQSLRDCNALTFLSKGKYMLCDIQAVASDPQKKKMSKGEKLVKIALELYKVNFVQEKIFPDLRYKSYLRLDFFFELNGNKFAIEFDGAQHKKPCPFFGGIKGLELTQHRDSIKNAWCEKNDVQLVRIDRLSYKYICELIGKLVNPSQVSCHALLSITV